MEIFKIIFLVPFIILHLVFSDYVKCSIIGNTIFRKFRKTTLNISQSEGTILSTAGSTQDIAQCGVECRKNDNCFGFGSYMVDGQCVNFRKTNSVGGGFISHTGNYYALAGKVHLLVH